jgi:curved DNA-binding protein CbpA
MIKSDYYQVLEANPRARISVIDAAWRAIIKDAHPDAGASGVLARELNEAHDILTDVKKRKEYDRTRISDVGKMIGSLMLLKN